MAAEEEQREGIVWDKSELKRYGAKWPVLALGWLPSVHAELPSGQDDWFSSFAKESKLDICAPWLSYLGDYSALLPSLVSSSVTPAPSLDSLALADRTVQHELITVAGRKLNAAMRHPLGSCDEQGNIVSPPSTGSLHLPALFVGEPETVSSTALSPFWSRQVRWSDKAVYKFQLQEGVLRLANEILRLVDTSDGRGTVEWHTCRTPHLHQGASGMPDFYAVYTVGSLSQVTVVGEIKVGLKLDALQEIIEQARDGRPARNV